MFWTVVIFLLVLTFIVVWHEAGHFFTAKHFGVRVPEFGIGFPPKICKLFRWQGTDFVLNLLPIGGYVNLAGELEDSEGDRGNDQAANPPADQDDLFYRQPAWHRFWVIFAGPAANVILAIIVFVITYSLLGIPQKSADKVFLDYVQDESPAAVAGLAEDQRLVSLQATDEPILLVTESDQAVQFINRHHGQIIAITYQAGCRTISSDQDQCDAPPSTTSAYVRTSEETPSGQGALGIALSPYQDVFYPWYQQLPLSVYYGGKQSLVLAQDMLRGLATGISDLVRPNKQSEVTLVGPIGMASELSQNHTFSDGWLSVLQFAGLLSLNLGVINLLPIPALDGGRIALIVAEKFVGRHRVARVELMLNLIGLVALLGLSAFIAGHDIWRIIKGG